ncbi:CoA ester lyase [Variovorax rhizosphaerae]|uniref:CoA ester lyase n=1 Tax=Variovorax rhizosphaerae TaxID=1836200 RepID=A0ABU8WD43_9BURK
MPSSTSISAAPPRSMLFVSGEKPERFAKAMAAGADLVCIDLEDAVAPAKKAAARADALRWLAERPTDPAQPAVALRLNAVRTLEGLRDVLALADATVMPDWVLLPKVEAAADLQCVHAWLGAKCPSLVALLETPGSIDGAAAIAHAGAPLGALMLGGADLSAELGAQFGWDALLYARARILHAARAANLQAWDVPHIDLKNPEGLADETRRVLALGFDCKTAIHPQQIPVIHDAFMPPAERIDWARALADAVPANDAAGAFMFRGGMVDAPVIRNARRILARAGQR